MRPARSAYGVEAGARRDAVTVVVGVAVPVLTYAFLASIWFLKSARINCAEARSWLRLRPSRGSAVISMITGPR